jgi:hypothetical protein
LVETHSYEAKKSQTDIAQEELGKTAYTKLG